MSEKETGTLLVAQLDDIEIKQVLQLLFWKLGLRVQVKEGYTRWEENCWPESLEIVEDK